MDNILSQEEINALLDGMGPSDLNDTDQIKKLSEEEKDVIGEVSNIAMGAASTTLSSLLSHRVEITAPKVSYSTWDELATEYDRPCVFIQIYYKEGLDGSNILLIKDKDVKYITDLMMGGDGSNIEGAISELELSAISEAMNQMMGTAATSLSKFIDKKVDITPPTSILINLNDSVEDLDIASFLKDRFVRVSFDMNIGEKVKTDIMQLYPFEFAQDIYNEFVQVFEESSNEHEESPVDNGQLKDNHIAMDVNNQTNNNQANTSNQHPVSNHEHSSNQREDINVHSASFQPFTSYNNKDNNQENINIIMDVPLEVRVELGRTSKSIKEILSFAPGTIVELDKLSGEPVDLLVNNKTVAKGEVVVIDESFGIRISEILNN